MMLWKNIKKSVKYFHYQKAIKVKMEGFEPSLYIVS